MRVVYAKEQDDFFLKGCNLPHSSMSFTLGLNDSS